MSQNPSSLPPVPGGCYHDATASRPPREGEVRTNNSQTHGLGLLKRAVKTLGRRTIDRRTSVGKALDAWRDGLIADLGGPAALSAQQLAVIELCVQTKLILDSVSAWMLKQPTLIHARRKALMPIVLQRQQLADALARYLNQLGLERKARPLPTLGEYLTRPSTPAKPGPPRVPPEATPEGAET